VTQKIAVIEDVFILKKMWQTKSLSWALQKDIIVVLHSADIKDLNKKVCYRLLKLLKALKV